MTKSYNNHTNVLLSQLKVSQTAYGLNTEIEFLFLKPLHTRIIRKKRKIDLMKNPVQVPCNEKRDIQCNTNFNNTLTFPNFSESKISSLILNLYLNSIEDHEYDNYTKNIEFGIT